MPFWISSVVPKSTIQTKTDLWHSRYNFQIRFEQNRSTPAWSNLHNIQNQHVFICFWFSVLHLPSLCICSILFCSLIHCLNPAIVVHSINLGCIVGQSRPCIWQGFTQMAEVVTAVYSLLNIMLRLGWIVNLTHTYLLWIWQSDQLVILLGGGGNPEM